MSAVVGKSAPAASPQKPRWQTGDHEFLPAALEILETPPSPVRMALLLIICAFVVVALIWSYVGRIDIIASAQGKIQPLGAVKVIQPLDPGKVQALPVSNGSRVKAGDVVVQLDPSEAEADLRGSRVALASYRAEALRRAAVIAAARRGSFEPPSIDWPEGIPDRIREREQRVLSGDLSQLSAALASLSAQRDQKQAEIERLTSTIASQEKQITIDEERVALRATLEQQKLGSKLTLFDAMDSLQQQRTGLLQQKGQRGESQAAIRSLERDAAKAVNTFVAENGQKLADAERQADDFEQRMAKASARLDHMTLTSPIDGIVQALSLTTLGQVVTSGVELMRIVPDTASFEIECYLPNRDIGFVKVGQDAVIKIDAFPFTRYGSISAKVSRIATDAIPEPDAQAVEANPAAQKRQPAFASAERTQNLVFPITLTPDSVTINADGVAVPISPGMAVSAEIKTGSRRILEFIFSPLVEIGSKALNER